MRIHSASPRCYHAIYNDRSVKSYCTRKSKCKSLLKHLKGFRLLIVQSNDSKITQERFQNCRVSIFQIRCLWSQITLYCKLTSSNKAIGQICQRLNHATHLLNVTPENMVMAYMWYQTTAEVITINDITACPSHEHLNVSRLTSLKGPYHERSAK